MNALDLLLNRQSCGALTEPAPSGEELDNILKAGLRTPDHGGLAPWRFITVSGKGIEKLSEIFVRASESVGVSESRAAKMPRRAPLIIIAVSSPEDHDKVPKKEQILSTGGAVLLMQLAAQAQGYNGIWRTGPVADNELIKKELGLVGNEEITGYLYLGTPKVDIPEKTGHDPYDFVSKL